MESRSDARAVILVVEDNPFTREMICDWLRRNGHVVHAASGERAALRLLDQEAFDLAIVGLNIRRVEGLSLVRSVQGKLRGATLILTTGAVNYEDAIDAMSPATPVVAMGKPYSFYMLEQVVKSALTRRKAAASSERSEAPPRGKCCGSAC